MSEITVETWNDRLRDRFVVELRIDGEYHQRTFGPGDDLGVLRGVRELWDEGDRIIGNARLPSLLMPLATDLHAQAVALLFPDLRDRLPLLDRDP